ncbi:Predicted neuraminidase (sialidase) [Alteribacillus bidgolensis]|uniref:Predicted neuraminidase (Sialidase) n=2 Tax=Alteribacillus bidgolensis TaxID=930129 RepID=A0A1G8NI54_9BACI|nr:Predicted neuraminidase (sialidase) [Alteribacillus bidgolensis]
MTDIDELGTNIPSLFPHNHASNIILLRNGDRLCVWFGGSREGRADISILLSRLNKGSDEWSTPTVVSNDSERSEQNPILFENPNGELWLIYTAQDAVHQDSAVVRCRISNDNGYTWSNVKTLFDKSGSFVRNPPVVLENGDIILPAYYSLKSEDGFLGNDFSVVKISSDNGKTWTEHEVEKSKGLVHMSIVRLADDNLVAFFRSRKADYIYRSTSSDYGKTWTTPEKTELPNNNASIQGLRLNNDSIAVIFNNINAEMKPPVENRPPWFDKSDMDAVGVKEKENPSAIWGVQRSPLAIAVSEDEGLTWPYIKNIVTDVEGNPEFSYPSIEKIEDNKIDITFTNRRDCIRYLSLQKDWLKS